MEFAFHQRREGRDELWNGGGGGRISFILLQVLFQVIVRMLLFLLYLRNNEKIRYIFLILLVQK